MFDLPVSAKVDRIIPKTKFYERAHISAAIRDEFTNSIGRITWLYKLAESTLNIPATDAVQEIQIFQIELKQKVIPQKALAVIDKAIPYPILFVLHYGDSVCFAIQHKLDPKKKYYKTDWTPRAEPKFLFEGVNLESIYQRLILSAVFSLVSNSEEEYESFEERLARNDARDRLEKEVVALENKVRNERQFNKKVELNTLLQSKRHELEKYL